MARRQDQSIHDWIKDENAITVFTDGGQAAWDSKGSGGWRRFFRWYGICTAILTPLLVLLVLANTLPDDPPPPSSDYSVGTDAAQAQVFLQKWLTTKPQPLPGGRVVTFNGQSSQRDVPEDAGGNPEQDKAVTTTTYKFVVADAQGNLWNTSVQTAHTAEKGTQFAGPPSLVLLPPFGDDGADEWPWPGVTQVSSSNTAIEESVVLWAKALTQENPAVLKQTIGDPDPTRSYQTVPSMTLGEPNIKFTGGLPAEGEEVPDDAVPDTVVLRVIFPISWKGVETPEDEEKTAEPEVAYDLLLTGANSGSPKVVAWSTPGPVGQLEAYMNAIKVGDGDVTNPSPVPTPSESGSSKPSGKPTG